MNSEKTPLLRIYVTRTCIAQLVASQEIMPGTGEAVKLVQHYIDLYPSYSISYTVGDSEPQYV